MVTLTFGNSFSRISGLRAEPFSRLRKELSYRVEGSYFAGRMTTVKYMIDKRGNFPSGLVHRVKRFLDKENPEYRIVLPTNGVLTTVKFRTDWQNSPKPYPDQIQALKAALHHGRGTVSMPTGTGKSHVIALLIANMRIRTLVVVPTLEIKKQLTENLLSVFKTMQNIRIENVDSAALKTPMNVDMLIIDEAHHVAAKTYQTLNRTVWKNIYHRFFFTATPFRNNTEENLLFEGIAGEVIYKLDYQAAIIKGYIVPVEAYYYDLPKRPTDAYTWAEVYKELVINNDFRNGLISSILISLHAQGKSTLCLVKEVAHGDKLKPWSFINGQDEESRDYIHQFNTGGLKVLIGTDGIIGEGVDTKPCEYVIIAGLGKAKSAFMQKIGRALRNYPGKESAKIILFRDPSHKFLLNHFRTQVKILKEEYGVIPQKLEY